MKNSWESLNSRLDTEEEKITEIEDRSNRNYKLQARVILSLPVTLSSIRIIL